MKLLVTDALWQRLEPLLPPPSPRRFRFPGRKRLDFRRVLTGILFVLKTGMAWDDLPAELGYGCGKTCREYLRWWHESGVWIRLHAVLLAELNGADQIDWSRALIDASFAKAPKGGEDTGPNPTDRGQSGSKHHLLTDAHGIPLAVTLSAANVPDVTKTFSVLTAMPPVGGKPGPKPKNPNDSRAIAAMTPKESVDCYAGCESPRSWPNARPPTAADWECSAGSSSGPSPGSTPGGDSADDSTATPNYTRPSSNSPPP